MHLERPAARTPRSVSVPERGAVTVIAASLERANPQGLKAYRVYCPPPEFEMEMRSPGVYVPPSVLPFAVIAIPWWGAKPCALGQVPVRHALSLRDERWLEEMVMLGCAAQRWRLGLGGRGALMCGRQREEKVEDHVCMLCWLTH